MRYSKKVISALVLLLQATISSAQSVDSVGTSGGSGPKGGLGDANNPVKEALCYVTDAKIPDDLNNPDTRLLQKSDAPQLVSESDSSSSSGSVRKVKVNSSNGKRQEILGFGHTWTDSTVENFNKLSSEDYDNLMQDLFSQQGNNMGFMRHTIGSSDLSGSDYSYADGGSLDDFNLGNDGTAMAKMLADMGKYKGDVALLGAPWSAPGWMKNNNQFIADETHDGNHNAKDNTFNNKHLNDLAEYFSKYVDAFKKYGVSVNAISPQNEPLNWPSGYPTMYMSAEDQSNLISSKLGKAMKEKNVEIWAYDHNTDNVSYPETVLNNNKDTVSGIAWHCYQSPHADYSVLSDFHKSHPDTLQFMTECASIQPTGGNIDFNVANNFILPVQNYASGATMWVLGTDENYGPHTSGGCQNCAGAITVQSGKYIKNHDYYMVGQFSRFIRRGAYNYEVTEGNEGSADTENQFYVLAEKNPDGSWAMVFMNNMPNDQEVELSFNDDTPSWKGTVPRSTVTTWVLPKGGSSKNETSEPSQSAMISSSVVSTSVPLSSSSTSSGNILDSVLPSSVFAMTTSSGSAAPASSTLTQETAVAAQNTTTCADATAPSSASSTVATSVGGVSSSVAVTSPTSAAIVSPGEDLSTSVASSPTTSTAASGEQPTPTPTSSPPGQSDTTNTSAAIPSTTSSVTSTTEPSVEPPSSVQESQVPQSDVPSTTSSASSGPSSVESTPTSSPSSGSEPSESPSSGQQSGPASSGQPTPTPTPTENGNPGMDTSEKNNKSSGKKKSCKRKRSAMTTLAFKAASTS
ncbi:hypothetical protein TRICI_001138 [Trichomonascus ciferrii]|uniref:Glycosyl hydrolase family 30 TIM-barrel domain-containing protein n=1 Tax=Trichomonascus ciferrii TaxID=44093 RepID=A0A642V9A4_9ASCO|nr:hypothetical protein TRICI_001138 [Trichomonascus ciferrii]